MTSTFLPTRDAAVERSPMDPVRAFAAVALAAVSWDGILTPAGSRALRHALDYRDPYRGFGDAEMVRLLDALLAGSTDYHSLRPDIWATNHPDHIRTYRKDERRDRADRKQRAREERRNAKG